MTKTEKLAWHILGMEKWTLKERAFIRCHLARIMTVRNTYGEDCCWIGCVRIAMHQGPNWKSYVEEHWDDYGGRGFRDWVKKGYGPFTVKCSCCGQTNNPLKAAMAQDDTFDQFVRNSLNYAWPTWPLPPQTRPAPTKTGKWLAKEAAKLTGRKTTCKTTCKARRRQAVRR